MKIKFAVVHKWVCEANKDNTFDSYNRAEYALGQIEDKYKDDYIIVGIRA